MKVSPCFSPQPHFFSPSSPPLSPSPCFSSSLSCSALRINKSTLSSSPVALPPQPRLRDTGLECWRPLTWPAAFRLPALCLGASEGPSLATPSPEAPTHWSLSRCGPRPVLGRQFHWAYHLHTGHSCFWATWLTQRPQHPGREALDLLVLHRQVAGLALSRRRWGL